MDSPAPRQAPPVDALQSSSNETATPPLALFRTLFDRELPYVWTTLRRLGIAEKDREDLCHEVFFRVHQRLSTYDPQRPAKPWLCAFAVRVASEHRRRAVVRNEDLGGADDAADLAVAPASTEGSDDKELVDLALDALDLDKRAVLVLHDLDGETVPEIAKGLGVPEGTVYSRLRAARTEFTAAVRRLQRRDQ
jgi:RNA polymerase sigma-70 factor, ECF subfamily